MTKVFSVFYDVGSYSDRSVSLSGVFSSEEKAQAFIDEKCLRPEFESKREEWNLARETGLLERIKYREDSLVQQEQLLLELYKEAVGKVIGFNSNNIRRTKENIARLASNDPHVQPYYLQTLEAYINNKHCWCPDKNDFSILESTLDVEIK